MLARRVPSFPAFREMNRPNGGAPFARSELGRHKRFQRLIRKLVEQTMDDAAQQPLRNSFRRRINRRAPTEMDRHLLVVLDHFKLGMLDADAFAAEARLAEYDQPLSSRDHFLHVMQ